MLVYITEIVLTFIQGIQKVQTLVSYRLKSAKVHTGVSV